MPFPNEHSARIINPDEFQEDSFRRKKIEEGISIIIGKIKGETKTTTQAYRFNKDVFTAGEAKKWLKDHDIDFISFEAASNPNEKDRNTFPIFVFKQFDEDMSLQIVSSLLYYETFLNDEAVDNLLEEDSALFFSPQKSKIKMWINSPGGYVSSLMSIIDTMNNIQTPIETYCLGTAASCAAVLLANGKKGKRFIGKNSHVLLHQVSSVAYGNIKDMEIDLEYAKRLNEQIIDLLSKATGKDSKTIKKDMERDLWLNAEEALEYGIVDKILDDNSNEIKVFNKIKDNMETKGAEYSNKEKKMLNSSLEIKSMNEDEKNFKFTAYASDFESEDLDGDVICKGAFLRTLKTSNLLDKSNARTIVWNHNLDEPIGIAYLKEDQKGLFVEGSLPKEDDFVKGRVIPQIRIGAIQKMSFGFKTTDSYYKNGKRYITDVELFEVSPATIASNQNAKILEMKANEKKSYNFETIKDVNNFLKSKGFTCQETEDMIHVLKQIVSNSRNENIDNIEPSRKESGDKSRNEIIKIIKEEISLLGKTINKE